MPVISGSNARSGYISLPPRILLHERDSATGSYPTMARTGDPDFGGDKPVKFDDTRTIIFSEGVTVSYPTLLEPVGRGLEFISGALATPSSGSDILAPGTVRKGVADQFVRFENSENLGPFSEHLRVLPNEGEFYLTGTDSNLLPGFSSRLSSKTIIKIPLTVKTESAVFWSTGTMPNALGTVGGVNSGISYFNFNTGMWEPVGVDASTTTGSAVDYLHSKIEVRSGSFLATAGGDSVVPIGPLDPAYRLDFQSLAGFPCSTFGFPSAQKFDATNGQKISLADYIKTPFAVEKIIFNWSGSLDLNAFDPSSGQNLSPHRATFGILNSFKSNKVANVQSSSKTVFSSNGSSFTVQTVPVSYSGSAQKDLIGFGRLQCLPLGTTIDALNSKQKCEFTFTRPAFDQGITGSFNLEFPATIPGRILPNSMIYSLVWNNNARGTLPKDYEQFHEWQGGRTGLGLDVNSANRSLIKPFVGEKIISSSILNESGYAFAPIDTNDPDLNLFESPYMLHPNDELIFFATNQPKISGGSVPVAPEALYANRFRWTFAPGESYVLLIGSQIRDGVEFHDTSNQPLNSHAVHEALHHDNPVVDQFQVEALNSYTGSYIDDVIEGDFSAGTRRVVGSSAAGTQGVSGSLIRGVKCRDSNERYYDTVLPSVAQYANLIPSFIETGGNYFPLLAPNKNYSGSFLNTQWNIYPTSANFGVLTSSIASSWFQSFPFESKFSNLTRNLSSDFDKDPAKGFTGEAIFTLWASGTDPDFGKTIVDTAQILKGENLNKFWFGFGPGFLTGTSSGISNFINMPILKQSFNPFIQRFIGINGFKYGVKNAVPEFSTTVTRHDRYGQFRDMLEQRQDSRFSTGETITDGPLTIKFVNATTGKPTTTPVSSSNKSIFATASVPFFDGTARN
jgi:hypothetical protein